MRYVVKKRADVSVDQWTAAVESIETARTSNDGTMVVLKFDCIEIPEVFFGETILDKPGVLAVLAGAGWGWTNDI